MASNPAFTSTPNVQGSTISSANTNRDGTGTIVDIFTAGSSGSKVQRITIMAAGTTSSGSVVRLYYKDGSTYFLIKEILVDAITPSDTVDAFRTIVTFDPPFIVAASDALGASTDNAETFKIVTEGMNF